MATVFETYITREGDTVDLIAFERFGSSTAVTEAILSANPNLASLGPKLDAGLTLRIPIPSKQDRKSSTRLWS